MKCSVCNTEIKANYCENCGQQYTKKKLTFKSLLTDVMSSLTDVEKNVFLNIYQIISYPNKIINGYWNGFRGYYYKPGKMLFYFVTIAGLSSLLLDSTIFGLTFSAQNTISTELLFVILFFPILTLSNYITYRKHKRTFIEHASATIYLISSFGIVILIFQNLFILLKLSDKQDGYWALILTTLIIVWNSFLYTSSKKFLNLFFNIILEYFVLIVLILTLVGLSYLGGTVSINAD